MGLLYYIRNINIAAIQDIYYICIKNNIDIGMNKNLYVYDNTSIEPDFNFAIHKIGTIWKLNSKTNTITYNLIDPIIRKAGDLLEGSQRWWVITKMKSDYEFIKSYGKPGTPIKLKSKSNNQYALTPAAIDKYESNWEAKVLMWYNRNSHSNDNTSIPSTQLSEFPANKYYIQKSKASDVLTIKEASNIPPYIKYDKDASGAIIGVSSNVDSKILSWHPAKMLTREWWLTERARYDAGDRFHPVAPQYGMQHGDFLGIQTKSKMKEYENIDELIKEHQRGWIQWVRAIYGGFLGDSLVDNSYTIKMNNCKVWNSLTKGDVLNCIIDNPHFASSYIPFKLYAYTICNILDILIIRKAINTKYLKAVRSTMKYMRNSDTDAYHIKNTFERFPAEGVDIILKNMTIDKLYYMLLGMGSTYMEMTNTKGRILGFLDSLDFVYLYNDRDKKEAVHTHTPTQLFDTTLREVGITSILDFYRESGTLNSVLNKIEENETSSIRKYGFTPTDF